MARESPRAKRVADQIQRELSGLIRLELKDPRIVGLLTITSVDVSPDLKNAKVFFTALSPAGRTDETLEGLQGAAGFLRSQLAQRLLLRVCPRLHFIYDTSVERGIRLSQLIDQAVGGQTTVDDSDNG